MKQPALSSQQSAVSGRGVLKLGHAKPHDLGMTRNVMFSTARKAVPFQEAFMNQALLSAER